MHKLNQQQQQWVSNDFVLSATQLDKVAMIHDTFKEVYPINHQDLILVFCKAPDSAVELNFWIKMRATYLEILQHKQINDLATQKAIFQVLLNCVKMPIKILEKQRIVQQLSLQDIEYIKQSFTKRLQLKWDL